MNNGYIALWRELMDKPIWLKSTPEQKVILITILCMVNHKENEWEWEGQKFKVNPGQVVTSLDSLVKMSGIGISTMNVRTALSRFEKLEFLTNISTKTGRLLTVVNWHLYQCEKVKANKAPNKDLTKTQQRPNKDLTPNKECNKDKNEIMKEAIKDIIPYEKIIDYLNEKLGTKYKHTTPSTRADIKARYNQGFTFNDFKIVIDKKYEEWHNNTEYARYLRPETLFSNKFEGYLNQVIVRNETIAQRIIREETEKLEQNRSSCNIKQA